MTDLAQHDPAPTPWLDIALRTSVTGAFASVLTTAALAALARAEGHSPWQPTNATSHWLHGEKAAYEQDADASHTLVGYGTHHASTMFWALPLELWLARKPARNNGEIFLRAAMVAAAAGLVDYGLIPKRLTPGWEEVLPPRSVASALGVLALGLGAGALLARKAAPAPRRQRIH